MEEDGRRSPATMAEWALRYAGIGWHVFPTHTLKDGRCTCGRPHPVPEGVQGVERRKYCESPGKHPRTPNGVDDATNDLDRVRAWWIQWPDSNVAIATGPSGLFVVDVD